MCPSRGTGRLAAPALLAAVLLTAALLLLAHPRPRRRRRRQHGPAGVPGQARLHPPLDRPGVARRRARRPRHRPARQQLLRQRHQLRLGTRLDRRLAPTSVTGGPGSADPAARHYLAALYAESGQNCSLLAPRHRPRRRQRDRHVQELLSQLAALGQRRRPRARDRRQPAQGPGLRRRRVHGRQRQGHLHRPARLLRRTPGEALRRDRRAAGDFARHAAGGRALANWLVDHWLQDAAYAHRNVVVFDYYTVLTSNGGSAGRQRPRRRPAATTTASGTAPCSTSRTTAPTTSPTRAPAATATPTRPATSRPRPSSCRCSTTPTTPGRATPAPTRPARRPTRRAAPSVTRGRTATLYYRVTDDQSPSCTVKIKVKTLGGRTRQDAAARPQGLRHAAPRALHLHAGEEDLPLLRLRPRPERQRADARGEQPAGREVARRRIVIVAPRPALPTDSRRSRPASPPAA